MSADDWALLHEKANEAKRVALGPVSMASTSADKSIPPRSLAWRAALEALEGQGREGPGSFFDEVTAKAANDMPVVPWAVHVECHDGGGFSACFSVGVQRFTLMRTDGDDSDDAKRDCESILWMFVGAMQRLGAPPPMPSVSDGER